MISPTLNYEQQVAFVKICYYDADLRVILTTFAHLNKITESTKKICLNSK